MSAIDQQVVDWLLTADEPWVRLQAMRELAGRPDDDPDVQRARRATARHPFIQWLLESCQSWPGGNTLTRHNNAKHPLHHLALLADLGIRLPDRGARAVAKRVMANQHECGAFQCWAMLPTVFGGDGIDQWCWMICDAPVLAHSLLALGVTKSKPLDAALAHIESCATDDGWRCVSSFPKVRGPGRKDDPCPYATLLALRALALSPAHRDSRACHAGTEMLLGHWEHQGSVKYRMFGIGTDYRKLKYPFIWYDILHVLDVLSRFPWTHRDSRFQEQMDIARSAADQQGRFVPQSVWMAFSGADFSQKKSPSPTLTLAVQRIVRRAEVGLVLEARKVESA
ncbi:MAG: hypothetical protein V2A73_05720 [Pseudomonadota bacterium]